MNFCRFGRFSKIFFGPRCEPHRHWTDVEEVDASCVHRTAVVY
jgi:hypothetical protein